MVEIKKIHTYTGHKDAVYALEKGRHDHLFYSAGGDGQLIEWDLNNHENGRLIAKVPASIYALHYLPARNIMVVGQNYEGIHLIHLDDYKEVASLQLTKSAIFDIQSYKNLLIIATGNGELIIVDHVTMQVLKRSLIAEKNLRTILITEDQKALIGTSDSEIIQIDLKSLKIENQWMAHENSVFSLRQKPNSPFILSGSRDARLKYWNAEDQSLAESINAHMYAINDIVFEPSGFHFATGSMDKTIKIWDFEKRKLIKVIDKARHGGHLTSVNKLLWTKFNNYLLSCSDDRSISVWDITF